MDYRTVSRPAFTIVGISARTSNAHPEEIGVLWQRYYGEGIASKIPNKKSEDTYSLYIDYESDHTQPYTLVIGCEVNGVAALPAGLVTKTVPAAKYAAFSAEGPQPQTVISVWQQVWASGLQRTYSGDFDVYSAGSDPSQQRVNVFVAIG